MTRWRWRRVIMIFGVAVLACAPPSSAPEKKMWRDPLTPQERAAVTARGPLRYAPDPQFPPFESLNAAQQAEGITPDILGLIAKNLRLTVITVSCPDWPGCLQAVRDGRADVLGTISKNPERETFLAFTRPCFEMPYVLFVRAGGARHKDFARLVGRRVGVVKEYYAHSWLLEHHPEVIAVPARNTQAGLEDLATGHLDAMLETLPVGLAVLKAKGITNVEVSSPVLFGEPQYLAVAKGNAVLLGVLQKGLDGLSPKERGDVFSRWTGLDFTNPHGPISPALKTLFLALVLFALFVLAWAIVLRRAVARKTLELRRQEQQLHLLLERNLAGIYRTTLDGRFCECNDAFASLLGYPSRQAVMAVNAAALYADPSDRQAVVERVLRERQVTGEILRLKRGDGQEVWTMANETLVETPGQEPVVEGVLVDITGRKKAEEALRESEARYRDLVENASDLICTHDLKGTILSANATAATVLGYPVKGIAGRNLRDALPPERVQQFDAYIETLRRDGIATGIMEAVTRGGEVRFWEYRNTLRTKGVDAPVVRGMARDVTDAVRAKRALKKSEEKYRTILESMEESYYEVDTAGNLTFFNDSLCRLLGYSKEELTGMNDRRYTDVEHAKKLYQAFNAVYRTGEPTRGFDWEIIRKDGCKRTIEASVSLRKDASGRPVGFRGVIRDVTERIRAEEKLRENEAALQSVLAAAADGILAVDSHRRVVHANARFAEIWHIPKDLLALGSDKALLEFVLSQLADPAAFMAKVEALYGFDRDDMDTLIFTDGRIVERFSSPMKSGESVTGRVWSFRDVTERRRAEERLRQADLEREQARSAEGVVQLIQGLAHEIRNPLFAININTAVLEKKTTAAPGAAEYIAYVKEHVDRLNTLMRDLLELGRHPLEGEAIECRLLDVARAAALAAQAQAPEAAGRVIVEAPEGAFTIRALPDRLQKALAHLILNALQNSPADSRVRVHAGQSGGQAFVEVCDEGPGIRGEIRDRLFDPFVTTHTGRRGLGLALAKHYVTAMNGTLEAADNDPPPGATFTVRLPLA